MSTKPFPKSAAKQFVQGTRSTLRYLEKALVSDDWEEVYQCIYSIAGNGDFLVNEYEDWAWGDR